MIRQNDVKLEKNEDGWLVPTLKTGPAERGLELSAYPMTVYDWSYLKPDFDPAAIDEHPFEYRKLSESDAWPNKREKAGLHPLRDEGIKTNKAGLKAAAEVLNKKYEKNLEVIRAAAPFDKNLDESDAKLSSGLEPFRTYEIVVRFPDNTGPHSSPAVAANNMDRNC